MAEIQDRHLTQKIVGVYQEVLIIVITELEDGKLEEVLVNSVRRPIPVPYEQ